MADFTPGPWQQVLAPDARRYIETRGLDLCQIYHYQGTEVIPGEANARLMAAAPDMLALLEETIAPLLAHPHEQCNMSAATWDWFCRIRATLTKAKGESDVS